MHTLPQSPRGAHKVKGKPGRVAAPTCPIRTASRTARIRCWAVSAPTKPAPAQNEANSAAAPVATARSSSWWTALSSSSAYANQLLTHFRRGRTGQVEADEKVLDEASSKERALQTGSVPADIRRFLQPVDVWELKILRKLCSLCSLTYKMATLTPRSLLRRHKLELITTSFACELPSAIRAVDISYLNNDEDSCFEGDGMSTSMDDMRLLYGTDDDILGVAPVVTEAAVRPILDAVAAPSPPADVASNGTSSSTLPASAAAVAVSETIAAIASAATPTSGSAAPLSSNIVALPRTYGFMQSGARPHTSPSSIPARADPGSSVPTLGCSDAGNGRLNALPSPSSSAPTSQQNEPAPASVQHQTTITQQPQPQQQNSWRSPADAVGAKLAEAAAAAAAAATAAGASAAGSLYAGLTSLPLASALSGQLGPAAAAAALAAEARSMLSMRPGGANGEPSQRSAAASTPSTNISSSSANNVCPSEWFVCDEPSTSVRYFVIQGSDTMDHWRVNLTFDPVTFEDASWGVKVHRGVYAAVEVLYERFLPLILAHLDTSPFAQICFTGHSIGGSMAQLLLLMYRHRGVLPLNRIATCYTFGAPAVFCQASEEADLSPYAVVEPKKAQDYSAAPTPTTQIAGAVQPANAASAASISNVQFPSADAAGAAAATPVVTTTTASGPATVEAAQHCVLKRLGLNDNNIRNVIMHRDLVPRAFSCDYSLVTEILRGWGPAFKDHYGLKRSGRKHLYYFIGKMMVLQPDDWHSFVFNDASHPMLPPCPELYALCAPTPESTLTASARRSAIERRGQPLGREATNVVEAVWELMDNPHPLAILGDRGAYLENGSVSRYHNPDNYTRALGRLIYLKRLREEKFPSRLLHAFARSVAPRWRSLQSMEQEELEPPPAYVDDRVASEQGLRGEGLLGSTTWEGSDPDDSLLVFGCAQRRAVDSHHC